MESAGWSAAGDGADDEEGLRTRGDRVGERRVRQLVGEILATSEEPQERPALLRDVIADRAAQHRVAGFERIDDRTLRSHTLNVELHFAADVRKSAKVRRELNSDHGSVWTSTERTAGKSRTMGAHVSPASADAYTCPPVVPKYTPHLSSESTAIASRSTLT